jgi:hypothetical protein
VGLEYHLKNCKKDCEGLEKTQNCNNTSIYLIFSRAIGNSIASISYGLIFDSLNHKVVTLFAETSTGDLFYGTVADMFYFLRWQGTLSERIALIGGDFFTFFQYIDIILRMLLFLWILLFFLSLF